MQQEREAPSEPLKCPCAVVRSNVHCCLTPCIRLQLSAINLSTKGSLPRGLAVPDEQHVLCMLTVLEQYVAVGTQEGRILMYDAEEMTLSHTLCQLDDSVLCMTLCK